MSNGRGFGARDSERRLVPSNTSSPIGTFTQKTLRQPSVSTSNPPRTGPAAVDNPLVAPQMPTAWARDRGSVNVLVMIARLAGVIMALPAPCTARNAINIPSDGANPQQAEAAINTPSPSPNSRRRPNRSPSEPQRNRTLARTRT